MATSRRCMVYKCGKTSKDRSLSFHSFPKREDIREQWILKMKIGQPGWTVPKHSSSKYYAICSKHFEKNCFRTLKHKFDLASRNTLKSDAIPTLYMNGQSEFKKGLCTSSSSDLHCEVNENLQELTFEVFDEKGNETSTGNQGNDEELSSNDIKVLPHTEQLSDVKSISNSTDPLKVLPHTEKLSDRKDEKPTLSYSTDALKDSPHNEQPFDGKDEKPILRSCTLKVLCHSKPLSDRKDEKPIFPSSSDTPTVPVSINSDSQKEKDALAISPYSTCTHTVSEAPNSDESKIVKKYSLASRRCMVAGCGSTSKDRSLSFHAFPKKQDIREEWLLRIKVNRPNWCAPNWPESNYYAICSRHFEPNCFKTMKHNFSSTSRNTLRPDAVPTLMLTDESSSNFPLFPDHTTQFNMAVYEHCLDSESGSYPSQQNFNYSGIHQNSPCGITNTYSPWASSSLAITDVHSENGTWNPEELAFLDVSTQTMSDISPNHLSDRKQTRTVRIQTHIRIKKSLQQQG